MDDVESVLWMLSRDLNRGGGGHNDFGDNYSVVNGHSMYDGQWEEGYQEMGTWFPLFDLFWDIGKHGLNPTEAEVEY